ncbi:MAG: cation transporter [Bryobacterales bacterium]|nr:cation transporter [Bryobacterales bacterium]
MQRQQQFDDRHKAMSWSLAVGALMLAGKFGAFWITGSVAILSDAAESLIHVVAVAFAAFSLWLSLQPASAKSPFGYERIAFFSAGFEGGMIIVAALWIIAAAVQKWLAGLAIERLGLGTALVLLASLINLALGYHLVRTGRRTGSLILEANGKHVLTDSWTSFGVVVGLALVLLTEWKPFDPLLAIAVAVNILRSGGQLVRTSVRGLMDLPDPGKVRELESKVNAVAEELNVQYHRLRFRDTGQRWMVSLHLLFADSVTLRDAHHLATEFETRLARELPPNSEVLSHLEPAEDHCRVHPEEMDEWP